MTTVTTPTPYTLAAELINDGLWKVNAETGTIYGSSGKALRRINTWGYVQLKFRDRDNWTKEHAVLAHRVIWEHVNGPIPEGLQINHLNGDKTDNRITNLELVTPAENVRHAVSTGLMPPLRGADHPTARLTPTQALEVYREAWQDGGPTQEAIAAQYGISRATVNTIKHGRAWGHTTGHGA